MDSRTKTQAFFLDLLDHSGSIFSIGKHAYTYEIKSIRGPIVGCTKSGVKFPRESQLATPSYLGNQNWATALRFAERGGLC
jgi:hypothetical protein